MCGITGSIGSLNAKDVIIDGLAHLEYRGYDSAGIALMNPDGLTVVKQAGRLQNLIDEIKGVITPYKIGIGHTRWATHGVPSDRNSHPHTNPNGTIAIVHNGIIENHKELRAELVRRGYSFRSDTDTEVIAMLLDLYDGEDKLLTVQKAVARLQGAYALGILFEGVDALYAVRHESPLIIGIAEGTTMIASDVPAILPYTDRVIYLENGDIARLDEQTVQVFDETGRSAERNIQTIEWNVESATKEGYPHFMLKEIYEQPETARQTLERRLKNNRIHFEDFSLTAEQMKKVRTIWITACGTAYHAGAIGRTLLEHALGIPVLIQHASEFRYSDPLVNENTLLIAVSQSGETADTLSAMREAKRKGARTIAITNVTGSTLAREADDVLYTWAGPEISVASTKAYTAQLMLFVMLSLYLQYLFLDAFDVLGLEVLRNVPDQMQSLLDQPVDYEKMAEQLSQSPVAFYIGRLLDHTTAMEGALKLKEISYIYTEAFPAGELKHGPIALIDKGTPVLAIATQPKVYEKIRSNIEEVKARGAYVIGIGTREHPELASVCDESVLIPTTDPKFAPLLAVIPTQLIAYYTSVALGHDVDKPRNLAKSVTVE